MWLAIRLLINTEKHSYIVVQWPGKCNIYQGTVKYSNYLVLFLQFLSFLFFLSCFSGPSPPLNSTDDRTLRTRNRVRKKLQQRRVNGNDNFYPNPPRFQGGGRRPRNMNGDMGGPMHAGTEMPMYSGNQGGMPQENGPMDAEEESNLIIQCLSALPEPKVREVNNFYVLHYNLCFHVFFLFDGPRIKLLKCLLFLTILQRFGPPPIVLLLDKIISPSNFSNARNKDRHRSRWLCFVFYSAF